MRLGSQYVNIDGTLSQSKPVHLGVPRGSVLGPLLLLVFINDLPTAVGYSVVDIYADDTTLSYSSGVRNAPDTLSTSLQRDMDEVVRWSNENKMILNGSKTKCMMVTDKRVAKNMNEDQLLLKINGKRLEQLYIEGKADILI